MEWIRLGNIKLGISIHALLEHNRAFQWWENVKEI